MEQNIENICELLDKLILDSLTLMEEEIELKLNIENSMKMGERHLVKSRYILGQNKVSSLQLPTKNSPECEALAKVNEEIDDFGVNKRELEINNSKTAFNPIKWFGYLVPQDLYGAQNYFKQALIWVVKAANVQNQLDSALNNIGNLKIIKHNLQNKYIINN